MHKMQSGIENKKAKRITHGACGFCFLLAVVLYVLYMQNDVLATAQHFLSRGITHYNSAWGAILITLCAEIVKLVCTRIVLDIPLRFYALYYYPSFYLLGLLTSITTVDGGEAWQVCSVTSWFQVIAYIVVFVLLLWWACHYKDSHIDKRDTFSIMYSNVLLFVVMLFMTCNMSNTQENYHNELKAERFIAQKDYDKALEVGKRSLNTSQRLSVARNYALARQGMLPQRLFEYPQPYATAGLLPLASDTTALNSIEKELFSVLGGRPGAHIVSPVQFLKLLSTRPSASSSAHDYLLCAHLLDKDLDAFAHELGKHYAINDSLPVSYKEALVLYNRLRSTPVIVYEHEVTRVNMNDFFALCSRYKDFRLKSNESKSMYGNTYWWYYYFSPLPPKNQTQRNL